MLTLVMVSLQSHGWQNLYETEIMELFSKGSLWARIRDCLEQDYHIRQADGVSIMSSDAVFLNEASETVKCNSERITAIGEARKILFNDPTFFPERGCDGPISMECSRQINMFLLKNFGGDGLSRLINWSL